jgi:hypothetical protein
MHRRLRAAERTWRIGTALAGVGWGAILAAPVPIHLAGSHVWVAEIANAILSHYPPALAVAGAGILVVGDVVSLNGLDTYRSVLAPGGELRRTVTASRRLAVEAGGRGEVGRPARTQLLKPPEPSDTFAVLHSASVGSRFLIEVLAPLPASFGRVLGERMVATYLGVWDGEGAATRYHFAVDLAGGGAEDLYVHSDELRVLEIIERDPPTDLGPPMSLGI